MELELRSEGRRSLRRRVRTAGSRLGTGAGTSLPSTSAPHLFAHPVHRLCSPECLLPPQPLQKVLLQRSVPGEVEQGGGTKPFCQVSKDLLRFLRASWPADHVRGRGGSEFECWSSEFIQPPGSFPGPT